METRPAHERAVSRWKVSAASSPLHLHIRSKADETFPNRSQHFLFAIFSFISCAVSIGYFASFYQVFIDGTHQHEAFYWRTLIWIVYVVHLWTTSSSNLQAGILSSQSAARKNILSPLFMNTLYLSVLLGMLFSCVVSLHDRCRGERIGQLTEQSSGARHRLRLGVVAMLDRYYAATGAARNPCPRSTRRYARAGSGHRRRVDPPGEQPARARDHVRTFFPSAYVSSD